VLRNVKSLTTIKKSWYVVNVKIDCNSRLEKTFTRSRIKLLQVNFDDVALTYFFLSIVRLLYAFCDVLFVGAPKRDIWKKKRILCWNRFEQTSPYSGACREDHKKDCIGGIARVYTAVNQLMKERPNAIFLNAGDHFQGTLWYNIHRWNVTAVFMNMLPHDVMVIIYI